MFPGCVLVYVRGTCEWLCAKLRLLSGSPRTVLCCGIKMHDNTYLLQLLLSTIREYTEATIRV